MELLIKSAHKDFTESGHTLIEINAVLIILSILASLAVPKMISTEENAEKRIIQTIVTELNSREILAWTKIKCSASGWVDDEDLFAQINYDLGCDYRWKSGAEIDGGKLYFRNIEIKLNRTPSTAMLAAKWKIVSNGN